VESSDKLGQKTKKMRARHRLDEEVEARVEEGRLRLPLQAETN
jgi:hypothetical protein